MGLVSMARFTPPFVPLETDALLLFVTEESVEIHPSFTEDRPDGEEGI